LPGFVQDFYENRHPYKLYDGMTMSEQPLYLFLAALIGIGLIDSPVHCFLSART
jgi:hypothetical protein